jgi:alpha-1,2-mannosyltransferase
MSASQPTGSPEGLLHSMRSSRLWTGPWPVLVLVLAAAIVGGVLGGFTDLFVYRYGGRAVLDGLPVYQPRDPVTGLRFTYPPFGAIFMVPITVLPARLAAALWTAGSVAAMAATVWLVRRTLDRPAPGWLIALLTGGALALEPVWQNLAFGQINLLLMLAVVVDLLRTERRWSGVLLGIAAGVKLTPLVFVVLLLLAGRRAAGIRAGLVFLGTVLVGFAVMPRSAAAYWTGRLVDAGRAGPPELAHNQSVYGALARLLDGPPSTLLWLVIAGPLAVAILVVATLWWRRSDRVLGTCLGAIAMLIASPIAWSHHWVWALPIGLALWQHSRWACAAWTAVFVARPILWPPWGQHREFGWSPLEHVIGNAYLIAALALAVWAGIDLRRRAAPKPAVQSG